jgi:hypothetical protein
MFQGGQSQLQGYLNQFQNVNYWLSVSVLPTARLRASPDFGG